MKRKHFTFTLTYPNDAIKAMLQRKGHNVYYEFKPITEVVLFPGGLDVSPFYYGEKRMPKTTCDISRDMADAKAFREALDRGLPTVGICRGAQFLHVMNGGSLWQDVNNHCTSKGHLLCDTDTNEMIGVTSTHHQMMRNLAGGIALATAKEATKKECTQEVIKYGGTEHNDFEDLEVVWHAKNKSLCFQPHPEYNIKECHDYFFRLLEKNIYPLLS